MDDYVNLIPKEPPKDLIDWMRKEEGWWKADVMTYKCISKAEAKAFEDSAELVADCREVNHINGKKRRPCLLKCCACEQYILADYIPKEKGTWTLSGVSFHDGFGAQYLVTGEYRDGDAMRCPACGELVKLRSAEAMKHGQVEVHEVVVPTVEKSKVILTLWSITRRTDDFGTRYTPGAATAFIYENKKWHRYAKWRRGAFGSFYYLPDWAPTARMVDDLCAPYMYLHNRPSLDGTELENAKFWEYVDQTYKTGKCYPVTYIRLYSKHPQVENFVTAGMGMLVGQALDEECRSAYYNYTGYKMMAPKLKWIDWKAAAPQKMLGINKNQLRIIRDEEWTARNIRMAKNCIDAGFKFEDYQQIHHRMSDYAVEEALKSGQPLTKIGHYLKKQKRDWGYLKDYWDMCERAQMDLTRDEVRWPRDLRAAHIRAQSAAKYKTSLKERKQFVEMTVMCQGLCWEHDGICIRPAASPEELIAEGEILQHCVGGYSKEHASGKIILFIRHSRRPERSWFTLNVDVRTKRIIQNHGYKNEMLGNGKMLRVPREVQRFVTLWQKEILEPWELPKKPKKEKKESNAPAD